MLPEAQLLQERLRDRRTRVLQLLDGLSADALNWRPLSEETNSVYVLAHHALGAERQWIHERVGRQKVERDRPSEFRARGEEPAALRVQYATVAQESERILSGLTEADMQAERTDGQNTFTVRWCLYHILEHYSEHMGQMALTRQLWENRRTRAFEI